MLHAPPVKLKDELLEFYGHFVQLTVASRKYLRKLRGILLKNDLLVLASMQNQYP
jgi:hypothetical protein